MQFIDLKTQYTALKTQIDSRIQAVLDHGQYILGPEVGELEKELAAFTGAKHCITVSSGTDALLVCLMALGIRSGDEVITTPFTFAATAEMVALLGARPVFVDIEPDTCNIDVSKIEGAITPRTRAILPVCLYGQVADMGEINAIASRNGGIAVIEDAAQSFGASYRGHKSCNLSTFGCTSFFPSKPLGCYGDGGAIFTSDDALAAACREIRVHGQSKRYLHTRIGIAGRMDTLQCAVLLAKLTRFEWELSRRAAIAQRYSDGLASLPGIRPTSIRSDRTSAWAQYTVFVDEREELQKWLTENGVPTAIHYPRPLHHQPAYREDSDEEPCPASVRAADTVLSLPMGADLSEQDQDNVLDLLAKFVSRR